MDPIILFEAEMEVTRIPHGLLWGTKEEDKTDEQYYRYYANSVAERHGNTPCPVTGP